MADEEFLTRGWMPITYTWKASGLCHKPLYFEEVQVERYGHTVGPILQPIASGAHFFVSVLALPYSMGMYPPHECMYALGYYRPGSCAPLMIEPIPLSVRGGLAAGGAAVGLSAIIGWLDFVLFPTLALFLALTGYALYRRSRESREGEEHP